MSVSNVYYSGLASNAQARLRQEQGHSEDLERENNRLLNKYNNLVDEYNALLDKKAHLEKFVNHNDEYCRTIAKGNVVAGYTGELSQESNFLKWELVKQLTGSTRHLPDATLAGSGTPLRLTEAKSLTQEQREYINLRLLCRAEWYDWCMHVEVLSKATNLVVRAFMAPSDANKHVRSRRYVEDLNAEVDAYHAKREQAMDLTHGESVRHAFEAERFDYWKDKVRYEIDRESNNSPTLRSVLIQQATPNVRFDLHLPAGRLTQQWGFDITSGKPAKCFRDYLAIGINTGYEDKWASFTRI